MGYERSNTLANRNQTIRINTPQPRACKIQASSSADGTRIIVVHPTTGRMPVANIRIRSIFSSLPSLKTGAAAIMERLKNQLQATKSSSLSRPGLLYGMNKESHGASVISVGWVSMKKTAKLMIVVMPIARLMKTRDNRLYTRNPGGAYA